MKHLVFGNIDAIDNSKWTQTGKQAQAIIGLKLSNELAENVCRLTFAKDTYISVCGVFQSHALSNQIWTRRDFYIFETKPGKKMWQIINQLKHLEVVLKAMDVELEGEDMAMDILIGLPILFKKIMALSDALNDGN